MRVSNRARVRIMSGLAALVVLISPGGHAQAEPADSTGDQQTAGANNSGGNAGAGNSGAGDTTGGDADVHPAADPDADPRVTPPDDAAAVTAPEAAAPVTTTGTTGTPGTTSTTGTADTTDTTSTTSTSTTKNDDSDSVAATTTESTAAPTVESTTAVPLAIAEVPTAEPPTESTSVRASASGVTVDDDADDTDEEYSFGVGAKSFRETVKTSAVEPAEQGSTTTRTERSAPIAEQGPLGFLALLGLPLLGSTGSTTHVSPAPWTLLWWTRRGYLSSRDEISSAGGQSTIGLTVGPSSTSVEVDDPGVIEFVLDDAESLVEVGNHFLTTTSTGTTTVLAVRDLVGNIVATHDIPGTSFGAPAVHSVGGSALVVTDVEDAGATVVTLVDPRVPRDATMVAIPGSPDGFRVGSDGTVYVLTAGASDVSKNLAVIDAQNRSRTTVIPIEGQYVDPDSFVATPAGAYLISYTPAGGVAYRRDIRFIDTSAAVHSPVRSTAVSPFFGDDPDARFVVTDNGDLIIVDDIAVTLVRSTDPDTAIIIDDSEGTWTVEGDTYFRTDIEPDGYGGVSTVLTIMDLANPEEPQEVAVPGEPSQRVVFADSILQVTEAKDVEGTVVSTTIYAIDPADTTRVRAATFDGSIIRKIAVNTATSDLHVWSKPDAGSSSATLRVVGDGLGQRGSHAFAGGSSAVLTAADGTSYVVSQVNSASHTCFSQVCVLDSDGDLVASTDIGGTAWTGAVGPDGSAHLLVADPDSGEVQHSLVTVDHNGWTHAQPIRGWAEAAGDRWEYVRFTESGRPFVVSRDRESGATAVTLAP